MFKDTIIKRLEKELDEKLVLQRYDGLDYIAGQIAIEHANAIFGYGNWSYEVKEVRRDGMFIHAIVGVNIYQDDKHEKSIYRQDLGTGKIEMTKPVYEYDKKTKRYVLDENGNKKIIKQPEEIQEMAYKGAVTDGLKRALRTLGKQFGLGLYDEKDQMQYIVRELTDAQREIIKPFINKLQKCKSLDDLENIGKELTEAKTGWLKPMIVYTAQVYKTTENSLTEEAEKQEIKKKIREKEGKDAKNKKV